MGTRAQPLPTPSRAHCEYGPPSQQGRRLPLLASRRHRSRSHSRSRDRRDRRSRDDGRRDDRDRDYYGSPDRRLRSSRKAARSGAASIEGSTPNSQPRPSCPLQLLLPHLVVTLGATICSRPHVLPTWTLPTARRVRAPRPFREGIPQPFQSPPTHVFPPLLRPHQSYCGGGHVDDDVCAAALSPRIVAIVYV